MMIMTDIKMKLKQKVIRKTITEITFDGYTTEFYPLVELINDIEGGDSFFPKVSDMSNENLRTKLEQLEVISVGIRGGVSGGKKFRKFRTMINKKMYDHLDELEKKERQK